MKHIIPTVFALTKKEFDKRLGKLSGFAYKIHVDFMDGLFVPEKSIKLDEMPDLKKYKNGFEAHLMTKNPEKYILDLKNKGFRKIIFHYEAVKSELGCMILISMIKKEGMAPFIAINPETSIDKIEHLLHSLKGVLLMGIHPGREKQHFKPEIYKKIKKLREKDRNIIIQVDGGANENVIKKLALLDVNFVNSGSFIAEAKEPESVYRKLNGIFVRFSPRQ